MRLLAFDSATTACTAALDVGGEITTRSEQAEKGSGERLLYLIDALLSDAQVSLSSLDAVVVGTGPGSFTGIRIALGVAQGLCLGADLPVIGVSSLAMMAQGVNDLHTLVVNDARMREVYWAYFKKNADGLVEAIEVDGESHHVSAPGGLVMLPGSWTGLGTGFREYGDALSEVLGAQSGSLNAHMYPDARHALTLGRAGVEQGLATSITALKPLYVRNQVAK